VKKTINKFLVENFGEDYWFSWQNLNDLPGIKDRQGHPFWHGRSWLHLGLNRCIEFSWNLKSRFSVDI